MAIDMRGAAKPVGTREWYDFVALVADVVPGLHPGGEPATRALLEMIPLGALDHVLDVGCGPGATATLIAHETGARVTGVDLSEEMVAKARERAQREDLAGTLNFQVGDVLHLAFSDQAFDAVLFESVLTVIPGDPVVALAEMARVVRPGGYIGGNEATIDPSAIPGLEVMLARHPAVQRVFTPATLREQFERAGLLEIEMRVVPPGEAPPLDSAGALRKLGLAGLLSFFLRSYPKLVSKLLRDPRFREAQRVDEQITKRSKAFAGYALIVGRTTG